MLCDGNHFRAGATRARCVALIFLDDASRFAPHAVVGTAESAPLFLRGLYECIARVGRADIYYLDRDPGFFANDAFDVVRKLGSLLIHGEVAYPEGHGRIERFNQTAGASFLTGSINDLGYWLLETFPSLGRVGRAACTDPSRPGLSRVVATARTSVFLDPSRWLPIPHMLPDHVEFVS